MIAPGFHDPVLGAQSAFRAVMQAMAQPGRIMTLTGLPEAPAPLPPAMAAAALALCDAETPLWHDAGAQAGAWLDFHLGAPPSPLRHAAFVLACGATPALSDLASGSDEAPQDGATLLLRVDGLRGGAGWRLEGPGIRDHAMLAVSGLAGGFVAARAALAPMLPRGVDIVLCCGAMLAAIPRSTRIREAG